MDHYPLHDLTFSLAYKTLASQSCLKLLHKWQDSIEKDIIQMIKKQYGNANQIHTLTIPEQIDEKLSRFYQKVNQMMTAHLFEKFHSELLKVLNWLLSFANRT